MNEVRKIKSSEAVAKLKDELDRQIDNLTDRINELKRQQDELDELGIED